MNHPDNFRSAMYRSLKKTLLAGCQDPSDHVESAAVRRYTRPPPPSTAMVSVGCGHWAANRHPSGAEDETGSTRPRGGSSSTGEAQLSRVSREAEKLQRVVDLWARQQQHLNPRSMDVAEGLLRGALELQESLAMLRELQEVSRSSRKRRSRREVVKPGVYPSSETAAVATVSGRFDARNYQRIYDNPWHSVGRSASGGRKEDFRKFAVDGFFQRQCLPAASSSEENTYFTQSLRFTSSSGSIASCSHFRSKSDSSDGSSVSCHKVTTRPPNLIVKLMGLEDAPGEAIQPVDKQVVSSNSHFDAKMSKARKSQHPDWKQEPDGKTFQQMIDTLKIKASLKGCEKAVRRASMDDSIFLGNGHPPIVVIKPNLPSFDEEIMRKDIHVDNSSSKKEEFQAAKVVDKEIVLDQNKKTLVKMLQGKEKKNEKAGKMELPHKNKLPPRTKLPTTTASQKRSTKPANLKNHEMPGQMPAVTTPFRKKVEESKNMKKTVAPPAEVRRARSLPMKVQKQPYSAGSQAVQRMGTSGQNRDSSVDHTTSVKEKNKARARSDRELKPQAVLNMVSAQGNSEFEDRNPNSPGTANPSLNTSLSSVGSLPEIEKQECGNSSEDGRENDSNFVDELMEIPIVFRFLSQEERYTVNRLDKPECSPCHDVELPTTSQVDNRLVNDRITVISEDEAQSADLRTTCQDAEIRNSKLLFDCGIELLQCRNYHVKLSSLVMLRSHAQNTYSLFSQDQMDEEIKEKLHRFKSYNQPAVDTAALGGLYWRLQMDLNCNGLMGIGGWDCGWIDGISMEEVEQIISSIEECIACKLIEEIALELAYSLL